eukprot:SAG31_NODE_20876_length_563_cov_1.321121_1_plen_116_part_01
MVRLLCWLLLMSSAAPSTSAPCKIHHTLGCFNISGTVRPVLPHSTPVTPGTLLSLEACAGACYGAKLTIGGVVDGATCFCGSSSDLSSAAAAARSRPKAECMGTPCAGQPSEKECG